MRERCSDVRQHVRNADGVQHRPGISGTIAAIVVGVGVRELLLWAARRAGGWRNLQTEATDRARQGYDYAREGYGRRANHQGPRGASPQRDPGRAVTT